ncbi:MAG: MBL fold metallo-hydrolase [Clostridiales bacterium]|nr:MBL fold metallo-hydrolase [Clostridiales bacterium]MDD7035996.1 MBL fold metallo-hydrolase [Bacillota bacterium]MDY2921111.1 MBL fold metallo-hydrolase [Lentihominibacter sp.]
MKFTFLMENKTEKPGIVAEHGLSLYIETGEHRILFDAGASDLFVSNAGKLGVDLSEVDLAVVSHGHYDHTGGFPAFCRINSKAPVFMQRNALRESYGTENGEIEEDPCGILWSDDELKEISSRIIFTDGPLMLTENIYVTGTIPVGEDFLPTEKFYVRERRPGGDTYAEDDMSHEQCLVVREDDGIFIFSGCSHRGVDNAIAACRSIFPGEKVRALVAGMHLYSAGPEARESVVRRVTEEDIDEVFPVHCTGIEGICMLKAAMGDRCHAAAAGSTYEF